MEVRVVHLQQVFVDFFRMVKANMRLEKIIGRFIFKKYVYLYIKMERTTLCTTADRSFLLGSISKTQNQNQYQYQ